MWFAEILWFEKHLVDKKRDRNDYSLGRSKGWSFAVVFQTKSKLVLGTPFDVGRGQIGKTCQKHKTGVKCTSYIS